MKKACAKDIHLEDGDEKPKKKRKAVDELTPEESQLTHKKKKRKIEPDNEPEEIIREKKKKKKKKDILIDNQSEELHEDDAKFKKRKKVEVDVDELQETEVTRVKKKKKRRKHEEIYQPVEPIEEEKPRMKKKKKRKHEDDGVQISEETSTESKVKKKKKKNNEVCEIDEYKEEVNGVHTREIEEDIKKYKKKKKKRKEEKEVNDNHKPKEEEQHVNDAIETEETVHMLKHKKKKKKKAQVEVSIIQEVKEKEVNWIDNRETEELTESHKKKKKKRKEMEVSINDVNSEETMEQVIKQKKKKKRKKQKEGDDPQSEPSTDILRKKKKKRKKEENGYQAEVTIIITSDEEETRTLKRKKKIKKNTEDDILIISDEEEKTGDEEPSTHLRIQRKKKKKRKKEEQERLSLSNGVSTDKHPTELKPSEKLPIINAPSIEKFSPKETKNPSSTIPPVKESLFLKSLPQSVWLSTDRNSSLTKDDSIKHQSPDKPSVLSRDFTEKMPLNEISQTNKISTDNLHENKLLPTNVPSTEKGSPKKTNSHVSPVKDDIYIISDGEEKADKPSLSLANGVSPNKHSTVMSPSEKFSLANAASTEKCSTKETNVSTICPVKDSLSLKSLPQSIWLSSNRNSSLKDSDSIKHQSPVKPSVLNRDFTEKMPLNEISQPNKISTDNIHQNKLLLTNVPSTEKCSPKKTNSQVSPVKGVNTAHDESTPRMEKDKTISKILISSQDQNATMNEKGILTPQNQSDTRIDKDISTSNLSTINSAKEMMKNEEFKDIKSPIKDDHIKTTENFCEICKKTFCDNSNFKQHMKRHSEGKLECDICGRKFMYDYGVKFHKKMEHESKGGAFSCDLCGQKFKYKGNLKQHNQHVHLDAHKKLHSCSVCGGGFDSQKGITFHMKISLCSERLPLIHVDKK